MDLFDQHQRLDRFYQHRLTSGFHRFLLLPIEPDCRQNDDAHIPRRRMLPQIEDQVQARSDRDSQLSDDHIRRYGLRNLKRDNTILRLIDFIAVMAQYGAIDHTAVAIAVDQQDPLRSSQTWNFRVG